MDNSYTEDNRESQPKKHGGKPFTKGDPRINRKGRPRNFDALRELAQQIANEVSLKDGEPLIISGHKVTVAEAILRSWAISKDPKLQIAFIEIAYGKVPDTIESTNSGLIQVEFIGRELPSEVEPPA